MRMASTLSSSKVTLPDGTNVQVSGFGDRLDWATTQGNEFAVTGFPDPCPICGHKVAGQHCQPYGPTPTTLVARCSVKNPDGSRCNGGVCTISR